MPDLVRRLFEFAIFATCAAFFAFFLAEKGMSVFADEQNTLVHVRDVIGPGVHELSGMIMLGSICEQLRIENEKQSPTHYHLKIKTWTEPYRDCIREETPRKFQTTVFAPAYGVIFTAELDGKPLEIAVIPILE